jgi:hypothetical protein
MTMWRDSDDQRKVDTDSVTGAVFVPAEWHDSEGYSSVDTDVEDELRWYRRSDSVADVVIGIMFLVVVGLLFGGVI